MIFSSIRDLISINTSFNVTVAICSFVCLAAGGLSAYFSGFSAGLSPWYENLNKPSFQPPAWLFGPVWTILYTIMGFTLALILTIPTGETLFNAFILQLVLNVLWSPTFFGYRMIFGSLVIISLLWLTLVLSLMYSIYHCSCGWLSLSYVPYIFWVSFASLLNYQIYVLN